MSFQLAWGQKVSPKFISRVRQLCADFGWTNDHANWLMSCMAFESGETFSPSIKNAAGSGATGLIQFMPATARGMNTSVEFLASLTAEEQLYYVREYFKPYYKRIKTLSDMYMAILLPKYVGRPGDSALFVTGTTAYRQNSGLDSNKDGTVTKDEATAKVKAKLDRGMKFTLEVADIAT